MLPETFLLKYSYYWIVQYYITEENFSKQSKQESYLWKMIITSII